MTTTTVCMYVCMIADLYSYLLFSPYMYPFIYVFQSFVWMARHMFWIEMDCPCVVPSLVGNEWMNEWIAKWPISSRGTACPIRQTRSTFHLRSIERWSIRCGSISCYEGLPRRSACRPWWFVASVTNPWTGSRFRNPCVRLITRYIEKNNVM